MRLTPAIMGCPHPGVQAAVGAMAAPQWEIRNSASITFTALVVRTIGFKNLHKVPLDSIHGACHSMLALHAHKPLSTGVLVAPPWGRALVRASPVTILSTPSMPLLSGGASSAHAYV
jgi:hypothetical protein